MSAGAFLIAAAVAAASPAALPGWAEEDHAAALRAYVQTCDLGAAPADEAACAEARGLRQAGEADARAFFERRFTAAPVEGEGLLTAYFTPAYEVRTAPEPPFVAELPTGPGVGSSPGSGLYLKPEDLFFLQIQGSGLLVTPQDPPRRAVYAGNNGAPYHAIGRDLVARGALPQDRASAAAVHAWLADHRGPEADAIMALNPRRVWFAVASDDGAEPKGAAGRALVPGRSAAVDPAALPFGALLWLDADQPRLAGATPTYRRLVVALDRGAAITGPARADLYLGRGAEAGAEAARVAHRLRLWRLVARPQP